MNTKISLNAVCDGLCNTHLRWPAKSPSSKLHDVCASWVEPLKLKQSIWTSLEACEAARCLLLCWVICPVTGGVGQWAQEQAFEFKYQCNAFKYYPPFCEHDDHESVTVWIHCLMMHCTYAYQCMLIMRQLALFGFTLHWSKSTFKTWRSK